jgi:hypothetical protein
MQKIIFLLGLFSIVFFVKAQRVGIGTNNPDSTLDVRGNIKFGGVNKFLSYDSASGKISWTNSHLFLPNNQQLIQHSASAEGLFYNNSALEYRNQFGNPVFSTNWNTATGYFGGNVGIGTSSPAARLHIQNGISGFIYNYANLIVEGNANNYISLLTPDNYQSAILFEKPAQLQSGGIYYNSPSAADGFIFRANNAPRMYIANNGNVGIGTYPQSRLHILDGASGYTGGFFPGITFEGSNNRYLSFITPSGAESGVLFGNNLNIADGGIVFNNGNTKGLQFRTNGNITRMVLNSNGFLGIGTFTPQSQLDINGGLRLNGSISLNGNEGQAGQMLKSTGTESAAEWESPTKSVFDNTIMKSSTTGLVLTATSPSTQIPGMIHMFTLTRNTKIMVTYNLVADPFGCSSCGSSHVVIDIDQDGSIISRNFEDLPNGQDANLTGNTLSQLVPGNHTIRLVASITGPNVQFGNTAIFANRMILLMIPE